MRLPIILLAGCFNEPNYAGLACDEAAPCPGGLACGSDGRCLPRGQLGPADFGTAPDAGALPDLGLSPRKDLGQGDASQVDAAEFDMGQADLGQSDLGQTDLGQADLGQPDIGQTDMGTPIDRCANASNYPTQGWEARYFILNADNTFDACFGVENHAGPFLNLRFMSAAPLNSPHTSFGSQLTATRNFQEGVYTFTLHHDDGMRLYIDGVLIYEQWTFGDHPNVKVRSPFLTAGDHQITIEHFDSEGFATIELSYQRGCTEEFPPGGWFFSYHPYNANGTIDTSVCFGAQTITASGFGFGGDAPADVLNQGVSDNWAMIARGEHNLRGLSRFSFLHDDGMRVRVDGITIYDAWSDGPTRGSSVDRYYTGTRRIVFEKYDTVGNGEMSIIWSSVCDLIPANLQNDWFAAYYRVTHILGPTEAWTLNRDDCLGTEIRAGATLESTGEPPVVQNLNVLQLWGADYYATRSFGGPTNVNLVHDDGLRVYLNQSMLYELWTAPWVENTTLQVPAGTHNIRLEYFQNNGGAQMRFIY